MLNRPEPACLVIADISGSTSYLAGTELDHSQDILADLISTVVVALRPTFHLAKLEGDAAFVDTLTETIDDCTLQDSIEEALGIAAYAFYSGELVVAMGLADPASAGLREHGAGIRALIPLIADDAARRRVAGSEAGEEEPPASAERFLREPLRPADVDSPLPNSLPQ